LALGYALIGPRAWPRGFAPLSSITRTLKFGGQSQLTNLVQLLNYRIDVFLILLLVNTRGVGLYTVATSQTEGLWIIADSVVVVLLTNITIGDDANAARMTPVVCRNTLLVTGVSAAVAALIAGLWIPIVFGSAYQESVLPYVWLLPGTVAFAGAKVLAAYVLSRGRPIVNAWIAVATFVVSVPGTVLLTHLWGVPGAAAGTSLGYGVTLGLTALAYRALSGERISEALVPERSDIALYTGFARSALRKLGRSRAVGAP
jgi:O-antigen/teichoic acid export membrane protein